MGILDERLRVNPREPTEKKKNLHLFFVRRRLCEERLQAPLPAIRHEAEYFPRDGTIALCTEKSSFGFLFFFFFPPSTAVLKADCQSEVCK